MATSYQTTPVSPGGLPSSSSAAASRSAGRSRVQGGGPLDEESAMPAPSLLHHEGLPPGPSLRASTRLLFASACGGGVGGGGSSDSSSDDEEDMPAEYPATARRHVVSGDPGGLSRAHRAHAAAAASAAAVAAAGKGGPAGMRVPTPAEAAHDRAERLWTQHTKWTRLLRTAAEMEDTSNVDTATAPTTTKRSGFVCYAASHPQPVRRLISRGIPGAYRGFVWQQLSGSAEHAWRATMMQQQFQLRHSPYHSTAHATASSPSAADPASRPFLSDLSPHGAYHRILVEHGSSPLEEQIIKDLGRTFPKQVFFKDRSGMGQNSLFHVLKAYACFDPTLGYCQGMGYIAAGLLQYTCEEDAFWLLVCLLHHPRYGGLRGLFLESMPKLNSLFYLLEQILSKDLPKLTAHFENAGMHLSMFSSTWFMTLYAGAFTDFENVARIWDVLMWQGVWFLVKVSVGILKHAEKSLLGTSFEHCLSHLKYLQSSITADQLIEQSLLVSLDYAECERWQLDFEKQQQSHAHPPPSHADTSTPTSTSAGAYSAWNQELDDDDDEDENIGERERSTSKQG